MFRSIQRYKLGRSSLHFLFKLGVGLFFVFVFGLATVQSSGTPASWVASPTRSLVPTASRTYSPTPSRTPAATNQVRAPSAPRLIPGQPVLDANTVALYHFDSVSDTAAIDATGNYTGTFNSGSGVTANGLYAGGLNLNRNQNGFVALGNVGTMPQGTIEMFIDFLNACQQTDDYFTILSAGNGFGGSQSMWVGVQGFIKFRLYVNGKWEWVDSGINPCRYLIGGNLASYWAGLTPYPTNTWPYETWRLHHVAITWGPRGMEIWVDGVLHGVGAGPTPEGNTYMYRCNPQMQLISWQYPLCTTPALNITAPYSYRGGLPAYSTMLLGCDVPDFCFNGLIDEVRISDIQRTFTTSIIPTLTPVPTNTPVSPSGAYNLDGYTGNLFHLNDFQAGMPRTVKDEVTQQYTAILRGNSSIVSGGKFDNGLNLLGTLDQDGTPAHVDLGHMTIQANGAIETWVKLTTMPTTGILINGGGGYQDIVRVSRLQLILQDRGNGTHFLTYKMFDPNISDWRNAQAIIPSTLLLNSWHHLVFTWGSRGMELWVDGVIYATYPYTGFPYSTDKFLIGCGQSGFCVAGMFDEFRVSTYQRAFAPPGPPTVTPTPTNTRPPVPGTYYIPMIER